MERQNLSMREGEKPVQEEDIGDNQAEHCSYIPCEKDMKRRIKTQLVERFLNGIQTFPVRSKEIEVIVES